MIFSLLIASSTLANPRYTKCRHSFDAHKQDCGKNNGYSGEKYADCINKAVKEFDYCISKADKYVTTGPARLQNDDYHKSEPQDDKSYEKDPQESPIVVFQVGDHKSETGGNVGCFGIDGSGTNKIKEIIKITPGFAVFFYTAENCVRSTRINPDRPPQANVGWVDYTVQISDIKSLRIVPDPLN
jgi:hypothetical protein